VHRLLRIKPIYIFTRYSWIAFFYLTFWTTFAPLVLFFANIFGKYFQIILKVVKNILIIFKEAFSRFEISPPVSNAFPLTKQNSP
jgi:hypothetical protein